MHGTRRDVSILPAFGSRRARGPAGSAPVCACRLRCTACRAACALPPLPVRARLHGGAACSCCVSLGPAVSPGATLPSRPRACTRQISRASSSTALIVLFRAMLPCAAAWLGAHRAPCVRSAGPRCALVVTLSAARCLLHTRFWPCHPCETRRGRRRAGARTLPSPWPHRVSPGVQDTRPCRRCPPTGAACSEPAQSGRHMAAEIAREPVHPSLYA